GVEVALRVGADTAPVAGDPTAGRQAARVGAVPVNDRLVAEEAAPQPEAGRVVEPATPVDQDAGRAASLLGVVAGVRVHEGASGGEGGGAPARGSFSAPPPMGAGPCGGPGGRGEGPVPSVGSGAFRCARVSERLRRDQFLGGTKPIQGGRDRPTRGSS